MRIALPRRPLLEACLSVDTVQAALQHVLPAKAPPPAILVEVTDLVQRSWPSDLMLTYGEVLQDNQEGRFLRSEEILRHIAERCETILKELRDEQPEAKLVLFLSDAEVPSGTERLSRKEEGHALDMLKYLALSPGANSESESQTRTSNRNSRRARTAQQAHEGVQTFASWVAASEMERGNSRVGRKSPATIAKFVKFEKPLTA